MAEQHMSGGVEPDAYEQFFTWLWSEACESCEIDTCNIQEKASALGLVKPEPYDPARHGENYYDLEPGDEIYVRVRRTSAAVGPSIEGLEAPERDNAPTRTPGTVEVCSRAMLDKCVDYIGRHDKAEAGRECKVFACPLKAQPAASPTQGEGE